MANLVPGTDSARYPATEEEASCEQSVSSGNTFCPPIIRSASELRRNFKFQVTGYVLDSSGYGLAAFRVAGALRPSSRFQQRDEGVPRRVCPAWAESNWMKGANRGR